MFSSTANLPLTRHGIITTTSNTNEHIQTGLPHSPLLLLLLLQWWVVRYWHGYLSSEVQMICIWSSWCHCHPIISCSSKIQNGLAVWCRLTAAVLEKRPLNDVVVVVVVLQWHASTEVLPCWWYVTTSYDYRPSGRVDPYVGWWHTSIDPCQPGGTWAPRVFFNDAVVLLGIRLCHVPEEVEMPSSNTRRNKPQNHLIYYYYYFIMFGNQMGIFADNRSGVFLRADNWLWLRAGKITHCPPPPTINHHHYHY